MSVALTLSDPQFSQLRAYVLNHTGLWYYADRDEDFASRLDRRFSARNIHKCAEYLHLLQDDPTGKQEMNDLVGELTIGETYFFRQTEHFDILRTHILPGLLRRNEGTRRLRIWSAGCATGAEPYSIAILLELYFSGHIAGWDISIVGTDINTSFLQRAREGRYGHWAFRTTPEWIRTHCFDRDDSFRILRPEYRKHVSFQVHNLATGEPPPGLPLRPFDLILCRNVMIYFARDLIHRTASLLYDSLAPGGWLLVGHAEPNAEVFAQFHRADFEKVTVYQRPDGEIKPEVETRLKWEPIEEPAAPVSVTPFPALEPAHPQPPSAPSPALDEVRLLADRGEWQRAMTLSRRLTQANPLDSYAHFTMGLILEHTVSSEEAEEALRRAIYLDRTFALAHYHLGRCLQVTHQTDKARKAFRNVLSLLSGRPAEDTIELGDGMTVAELRELAKMHIGLLGAA